MKASPMFNCLPGTMLSWRRMHEWSLGRSCGRALLSDPADLAASHRLFNPVQRWPRFLVTTACRPLSVGGLATFGTLYCFFVIDHESPPPITNAKECNEFVRRLGLYLLSCSFRNGT